MAPTPDIMQVAVMLMRQRALIVRTTLIVAILAVLSILVRGHTYTATGSFIPAAADSPQSSVAGLAAQFGFTLPASAAGQSADFYAELLQSNSILTQAVSSEYRVVARTGPPFFTDTVTVVGTLDTILGVDKSTQDESYQETVRRLRKALTVSTGRQSGTVSVRVSTDWPELSYQILARLLSLVDDFNRSQRQSHAATERAFIEDRLKSATVDLRAAEDRMESFLSTNRAYTGSPQLRFENDRLLREIELRQRVVAGLTDGYEKARIEEVRNTPVITVVEGARVPALPDRRRLLLKSLLALVGGGILGMVLGFTRETFSATHLSDSAIHSEYSMLTSGIIADIRRPWRLLQDHPSRQA